MRRGAVVLSVPVISVATCLLGLVLAPAAWSCGVAAHGCPAHGMWRDVLMLAVPLLVLLAFGLGDGARQLYQTWRGLRVLHAHLRPVSQRLHGIAARLELGGRIEVVDARRADAFCYGLLRPRICLTSALEAMLDDAELEAVLRHERHHLSRYDPLRVLGWTVLRCSCWWFEADALRAELGRELAADRMVIANGGRRALASALHKLLTTDAGRDGHDGLAVSGLTVTDARLEQLIAGGATLPPAPSVARWLVLPALLAGTLGICGAIMSLLA